MRPPRVMRAPPRAWTSAPRDFLFEQGERTGVFQVYAFTICCPWTHRERDER